MITPLSSLSLSLCLSVCLPACLSVYLYNFFSAISKPICLPFDTKFLYSPGKLFGKTKNLESASQNLLQYDHADSESRRDCYAALTRLSR